MCYLKIPINSFDYTNFARLELLARRIPNKIFAPNCLFYMYKELKLQLNEIQIIYYILYDCKGFKEMTKPYFEAAKVVNDWTKH